MKKKKDKYLPLEFCGKIVLPDMEGLKNYEQYLTYCGTHRRELARTLVGQDQYMEPGALAPLIYTAKDWLAYKQSYRISKEFAEDLFSSEAMDFPLADIRLPFPTIYLDFEELEGADIPKGAFCTISEVPTEKGMAHMCSMIFLFQTAAGTEYAGMVFDYRLPISVEENIEKYGETEQIRQFSRHVLQFAAYLASYEPDVIENPVQKKFYKASSKPKVSSVRKWDVGVRYRKLKAVHRQTTKDGLAPGRHHASPRPHVRKGHWHTYKVGQGRKETRLKWLPPVMVGKGEGTTVINEV